MWSVVQRHPGFRRLWAAGAVSLCGDWLSFVAVSVLALTSGGGAIGLALVFAAHALPAALLAPVAGALVDGLDRRRVLVVADLVAAVVTALMAIAALAGQVALVPGLLLVRSAVTAIVPPAESAAVRRLVPATDLVAANGVLAATWSVAYVAGMALGGAAALLGPALALGLDAATFLIASAIHGTLPTMPSPAAPRRVAALVRATPRDTIQALRVAGSRRPLLTAVLGKTPLALGGGAAWVGLNLIGAESEPFGAAALSFGVLQAIRGVGTGVGPAAAHHLLGRGADEARLQHGSRIIMLAAVTGLIVARDPIGLAVVALVWGAGTGANWVLSHAAIQRHADDTVIGRLSAFDELLVTLSMVVSAFIGAAAAEVAGPGAAAAVGLALGVIGVAATAAIAARAPDDPDAPAGRDQPPSPTPAAPPGDLVPPGPAVAAPLADLS